MAFNTALKSYCDRHIVSLIRISPVHQSEGAQEAKPMFLSMLLAFTSESIKYYFLTLFISKYLRSFKLSAKNIDFLSFENTPSQFSKRLLFMNEKLYMFF